MERSRCRNSKGRKITLSCDSHRREQACVTQSEEEDGTRENSLRSQSHVCAPNQRAAASVLMSNARRAVESGASCRALRRPDSTLAVQNTSVVTVRPTAPARAPLQTPTHPCNTSPIRPNIDIQGRNAGRTLVPPCPNSQKYKERPTTARRDRLPIAPALLAVTTYVRLRPHRLFFFVKPLNDPSTGAAGSRFCIIGNKAQVSSMAPCHLDCSFCGAAVSVGKDWTPRLTQSVKKKTIKKYP
jgi:hypothetical protein